MPGLLCECLLTRHLLACYDARRYLKGKGQRGTMRSSKLMFLGFLVILVGISWLYSLGTALPGDGSQTINPLVQVFYSASSCVSSPPSGVTCTGNTNPAGDLIEIVRTQEIFALLLILGGLGIALVGYFRQEPPPVPPPAPRPDEG